jgi:hypothetical protein
LPHRHDGSANLSMSMNNRPISSPSRGFLPMPTCSALILEWTLGHDLLSGTIFVSNAKRAGRIPSGPPALDRHQFTGRTHWITGGRRERFRDDEVEYLRCEVIT